MNSMLTKFAALAVCVCMLGCETVASVAQGVADSARGSKQAEASPTKPQPGTTTQDGGSPCVSNFVAEGNVITGKLFKSSAPLAKLPPDQAFRKVLTEVAKRGWQVTSSDKESRVVMASQSVNFSSSGKGTPINFSVVPSAGSGAELQFTYTMAGGTFIAESAVRDLFCKFVADVAGAQA